MRKKQVIRHNVNKNEYRSDYIYNRKLESHSMGQLSKAGYHNQRRVFRYLSTNNSLNRALSRFRKTLETMLFVRLSKIVCVFVG